MKPARYEHGTVVPTGFPNVDAARTLADGGTSATAYATDTVVSVAPVAEDAWIAINASPTAAAEGNGSMLIPYGNVRDINVSEGHKINTTKKLNVTPYV